MNNKQTPVPLAKQISGQRGLGWNEFEHHWSWDRAGGLKHIRHASSFFWLRWNIKGDDILCESMATNDYREGTVALTSWHKQGNRLEKMAHTHTHTHVLEHESKFIWLASVCRVRARCKVGDAVWSDSSLAANTLTRRFLYCQMQNKVCHCLCSRPPKCQS